MLPRTKNECEQILKRRYIPEIINSLKGTINDYINYLRDTEYEKTTWKDVLRKAESLHKDLAHNDPQLQIESDDEDEDDERYTNRKPREAQPVSLPGWIFDILTDADKARMKAVCFTCSKEAEKQYIVKDFRGLFLGHKLLNDEEYRSWITSPGLGLFRYDELQRFGVSPLSSSEIVARSRDNLGFVTFKVAFSDPICTLETTVDEDEIFLPKELRESLSFQESYFMRSGSVLRRLRDVGKKLAEDYKWDEASARLFLATGAIPENLALRFSSGRIILGGEIRNPQHSPINQITTWQAPRIMPGMVEMQVPSWLTPKQLIAIYRHLSLTAINCTRLEQESGTQKSSLMMLPAGKKPAALTTELFLFVEKEKAEKGLLGKLTLPQRRKIHEAWIERWNAEEHGGKECPYQKLRLFNNAYKQAAERHSTRLTGKTHSG